MVMRTSRRNLGWIGAALVIVSAAASAQAPATAKPDPLVGVKTKAELDALVTKFRTDDAQKGLMLFKRSGGPYHIFVNEVSRRRGVPEMHVNKDECFVVLSGNATLTIGGTLTDGKARSGDPNEWQGADITGGRSHAVAAGDVVSVPRGTPHSFDPGTGEIVYLGMTVFGQNPAAAKPPQF
jgi:mannose-6-phosphate isomerase-like protein (cupin superfamily)